MCKVSCKGRDSEFSMCRRTSGTTICPKTNWYWEGAYPSRIFHLAHAQAPMIFDYGTLVPRASAMEPIDDSTHTQSLHHGTEQLLPHQANSMLARKHFSDPNTRDHKSQHSQVGRSFTLVILGEFGNSSSPESDKSNPSSFKISMHGLQVIWLTLSILLIQALICSLYFSTQAAEEATTA